MQSTPTADVRITTPPKQWKAVCKYCKTGFEYTYQSVVSKPGGSSSRGKVTHYGLRCPFCNEFHQHRDST